MEYQIREANLEDMNLVIDFITRLLFELDGSKVELDNKSLSKAYSEFIMNDNNKIYIASDREKEIGIITVAQSIAIYTQGRYGIINEFYVLPEYRSSGIGKLLLSEVIKFGKSKAWKRIEVGAPHQEKWQRTIDFYIREGFKIIGPRLKKYI